MSLLEIKQEIRRMTPLERKEIEALLAELPADESRAREQAASFAEAKAQVFENYGDLLHRLSK